EVDWKSVKKSVKKSGVELRGGGADEAPECYKKLHEVLSYHEGTIEVCHRLRPIGVAMAAADVFDPYKD
ncbi:MAG: RtcB family protein, partial [Bacteroidota bacterium]